MPPPELPGDAPVVDILHPAVIIAREPLRHETDVAVPRRRDGGRGERFHLHPPLHREHRLQHRAPPLGVRHGMAMRLRLEELARRREIVEHASARFLNGQARVPSCRVGHPPVEGEDRDLRQVVTQANLVIVPVVCGRHLDRAGAERRVHMRIRDDGDAPPEQRQHDHPADQRAIPLVLRVDRHGGIAQHRLRPRRGDGDRPPRLAVHVVADVPEVAILLDRIDLQVRDGRLVDRIPVDHPVRAIDQATIVEPLEGGADGARGAGVHREDVPGPVERKTEGAQLIQDTVAVMLNECPDALQERLAPELLARQPLFRQLALHHDMHGDAGVVGAGQPERRDALHPLPPDQDILDGIHRVAIVERARDVRRRQDDDERLRLIRPLRRRHEVAALLPPRIDRPLDRLRVVHLRQFTVFREDCRLRSGRHRSLLSIAPGLRIED